MPALKELTESDLYHVFAVERRGDTLIVAPRGDATSFPEHHFREAVTALRRRLDGRNPCNVIIDLSEHEYPGLAMLGVFDEIINEVGWRGETIVVAGATDDTLRVLEEYELGRDWKHYDDLDSAVGDVVHEPIWKSVSRHPAWLAGGLVALLLVAGVGLYFASRTHPDRVAYDTILALWTEYANAQVRSPEVPDLTAATKELSGRVDELAESVAERRRTPGVIAAARQLQTMLRNPKPEDEAADSKLIKLLVVARDEIERAGH